jgi:hypothetical protein
MGLVDGVVIGELVRAASKAWLTGSTVLAVLARNRDFFSFYLTLVQDEVHWTPPKGGGDNGGRLPAYCEGVAVTLCDGLILAYASPTHGQRRQSRQAPGAIG